MNKLTSYVIDWDDLARWAGEQPREKKYAYLNYHHCASAQYLRSRGMVLELGDDGGWWVARDQQTHRARRISYFEGDDGESERHDRYEAALQSSTFGELRDALLALLGEESRA